MDRHYFVAKKQRQGTLNQKQAIKLLVAAGWTQTKGGKHNVKMTKKGERPITLPHHRGSDYGVRLRSAIMDQAGLDSGG